LIRIAVLGCGRIGKLHAQNVAQHPRAILAAVYDVIPEAAKKLAEAFGCDAAPDVDAIIGSSDVDAVLIASATETHADYIESAARAGKAVFCEKPIDLSLDRVNRCAAQIAGANVPIQIGFNRRFDPGHRAAYQALKSGKIGTLRQVIITSRDPSPPPRSYVETSGGLLRDMTIHDFDMARFMLMDEPIEVFAVTGALIDPDLATDLGDADTAMVILRTADGKQCNINNSRAAAYGYDQRIELLGETGMALSDNRKPHEMRIHDAGTTEASAAYLNFFVERYREAYVAELDAFIACLENRTAPEVGFEDGRRAQILAEAAYRSIAERRLVGVDELT